MSLSNRLKKSHFKAALTRIHRRLESAALRPHLVCVHFLLEEAVMTVLSNVRSLSRRDYMVMLVLTGSLWGLSEVVANGVLRAVLPQMRAGVLVGIAMLLMGVMLGYGGRPALIPIMALLAVASRQLVVPMLGVSLSCKANASLAVMLQAGAMTGVASGAGRRLHGSVAARAVGAATAALLSAAVFWSVGLHLAPCAYLSSFGRPGGLAAFLLREGLVWAALAGVAMPAGYAWGRRAMSITHALALRPGLMYVTAAAVTLVCWVVTGIATVHGY